MTQQVLEFVKTEDGSLSLLDPETNELYHNRAGAYTEALHNYVTPSAASERLAHTGELFVLDVCFGLGYNSFVLMQKLLEQKDLSGCITIIAIEQDPKILDVQTDILKHPFFTLLQSYMPSNDLDLTKGIVLKTKELTINLSVVCDCLRKYVPTINQEFDIVFHDPFSCKHMPELWSVDLFNHYYRILSPRSGVMLTYSAAVAVRGGLKEAGFEVFRTASVGNKSGGTLAISKDTNNIANVSYSNDFSYPCFPLSKEELAKLSTSSAIPYRDPQLCATRQAILQQRDREQKIKKQCRI